MSLLERWLCAALLCVCALLVCCAWSLGAPAPFPRPERRPAPLIGPGRWVMTWAGTNAPTDLYPDGRYVCELYGLRYEGTWSFRDGVLRVSESTNPSDPTLWRYWSAPLCHQRKGRTGTDGDYPGTPITLRRTE